MHLHRMATHLRIWRTNTRGSAGIEFAILGAVMSMLLVVGADIGMGFYSYLQLQNAAQAGAEYAAVHGFSAAAISSAVTSATSGSGISASPTPLQFCGCPGSSGISTVNCGSICPDGMSAGSYATVSATRTYTTLVSYPGFPTSYVQMANSTVRIQ